MSNGITVTAGHAPISAESGIVEVPLEVDPDASFLPPEWR